MWLSNVECEAVRVAIQHSSSMYLASTIEGKILWANESFCEWSQYSLLELQRMTWMDLSVKDHDLAVDLELVKTLSPYNLSYRIQKRYIPKNGKPQIGNLSVTRYPASGDIQFCWCRWEPLTNGTAQAFELAIESTKKMTTELTNLANEVRVVTSRSEEENWIMSSIKLVMKYPKIAAIIATLIIGGTSLEKVVTTLQKLGLVSTPPVIVQEIDHSKKD